MCDSAAKSIHDLYPWDRNRADNAGIQISAFLYLSLVGIILFLWWLYDKKQDEERDLLMDVTRCIERYASFLLFRYNELFIREFLRMKWHCWHEYRTGHFI